MGHRRSLEELGRKGGPTIADDGLDDLLDDQGDPGAAEPLDFKPPEPANLIMDWIVLVVGIVAVIAGLAGMPHKETTAQAPPAAQVSTPSAAPPHPTQKVRP